MKTAMERVIECLNTAAKSDSAAVRSLMINRVPCNSELATHPEVEVGCMSADLQPDNKPMFEVGALGLINGVLRAAGLESVAMQWSAAPVNKHGQHQFIGFCVYQPPQPPVECSVDPQRTHGDVIQ